MKGQEKGHEFNNLRSEEVIVRAGKNLEIQPLL